MKGSQAPTASRRFVLFRLVDSTGVSGTGVVADGVEFPDGAAVIRWRGRYGSTVVWDGVDHALHVHGHDGDTQLVWLDREGRADGDH